MLVLLVDFAGVWLRLAFGDNSGGTDTLIKDDAEANFGGAKIGDCALSKAGKALAGAGLLGVSSIGSSTSPNSSGSILDSGS